MSSTHPTLAVTRRRSPETPPAPSVSAHRIGAFPPRRPERRAVAVAMSGLLRRHAALCAASQQTRDFTGRDNVRRYSRAGHRVCVRRPRLQAWRRSIHERQSGSLLPVATLSSAIIRPACHSSAAVAQLAPILWTGAAPTALASAEPGWHADGLAPALVPRTPV